MPISWRELDKIKPNEITMKQALKRLKEKILGKIFLKLTNYNNLFNMLKIKKFIYQLTTIMNF